MKARCKVLGSGLMGLGVVVLAAVVLVSAASVQADWPQFLGPDRNGIAADAEGLARQWPAGGPRVLWRVSVGAGFAGPAIFGDSVLLLDREGNERDVIRRINLADGNEVWRFPYDAPGKLDHNGSRSTPATDGQLVFTAGPFGHVNAVRFSDGRPVWKAHLLEDWEAKRPNWGVAQSPLLMGNAVIFSPWGRKAAVVACNKESGEVIWTTANPDGTAQDYQSPVPMMLGRRQTIVASGRKGYTIGLDPRDGRRLWTFKDYSCGNHIPSPTVVDGGRVLLTGGYNAGGVMFVVERGGDSLTTRTLWKNDSMGSKIPQALLHEGYIYGNSSDTRGGLRCVSLDGEVVWETKNSPGFDMGNLLLADGLIFIVNGGNGDLVMCEATPEEYRELGRARVLSGQQVWGPLAYSDGKLVLRDQKQMVCVDLTAGE